MEKGVQMKARLSSPVWQGSCTECNRQISFSPQEPMIEDEHEYRCGCGSTYWINRDTGYYSLLKSFISKDYKINIKVKHED